MLLRLQLQIDIDTTSKEAHVVNQRIVEGLPHCCPNAGCGKPLAMGKKYCSRGCFNAVGKRPSYKRRTGIAVATGLAQKAAVLRDSTLVVPQLPPHDYAQFSFHQGVTS